MDASSQVRVLAFLKAGKPGPVRGATIFHRGQKFKGWREGRSVVLVDQCFGNGFDRLFSVWIVRDQRDLRARKDRAGVAHGSVVLGRQRYVHFLGSRLCDAHGEARSQ